MPRRGGSNTGYIQHIFLEKELIELHLKVGFALNLIYLKVKKAVPVLLQLNR